jgi:SAM-dependent methyltransferase
MTLFYRIAYALGFTPWEAAGRRPAAAAQVAAIFGRAAERLGEPGRALDLGCGRGGWSRELARRGWQVTGVDLVPGAIRQARRRAAAERLSVRFLQGDITRLSPDMLGTGFDFIWDFGAEHGLAPAELVATGRGVTALAAPGAELVMMAFAPRRRGPGPRGLDREEVAGAYPGWRIAEVEPFAPAALPEPLRAAAPCFWRLLRE